jgi:O-antigen/teichoic acid export membrane protein
MLLNYIKKNSLYLEQAFSSMFSFLITILILRLFGIKIFGIFSFLWIILLFIYSIQLSIIIYPMNSDVFKNDNNGIEYYYSNALMLQIIFSFFFAFVVYFFLNIFGNSLKSLSLEVYSTSFAILIFLSQFFQFIRRKLILNNHYLKSLITNIAILLCLLISIYFLQQINSLNLNNFFYIFSLSFVFGIIINLKIIFPFRFNFNKFIKYINFNWTSSKWLLFTSIIQWFGSNFWLINSGVILGPKILGVIRACQTILNTSSLLFQSIESLVPKKLSLELKYKNVISMNTLLNKLKKKFFLITIMITFFIILTSKHLLQIFYGSEMTPYYYILIFLSLMLPITLLRLTSEFGLRALKKTKPIFNANLFASIFTIFFSNIIISNFNTNGLIAGLFVNQLIICLVIIYYYRVNISQLIIEK